MFETLEDVFERSKRPLDRRWPTLMYSMYVALGLFYLIEGVREAPPVRGSRRSCRVPAVFDLVHNNH